MSSDDHWSIAPVTCTPQTTLTDFIIRIEHLPLGRTRQRAWRFCAITSEATTMKLTVISRLLRERNYYRCEYELHDAAYDQIRRPSQCHQSVILGIFLITILSVPTCHPCFMSIRVNLSKPTWTRRNLYPTLWYVIWYFDVVKSTLKYNITWTKSAFINRCWDLGTEVLGLKSMRVRSVRVNLACSG